MFRSRIFLTYFALSLLVTLTMWWLWIFNRNDFPALLPLNQLAPWGINQLQDSASLWLLPFYATATLLITTLLSWLLWKKDQFYAQIMVTTTTFLLLFALLSIIRIAVIFT